MIGLGILVIGIGPGPDLGCLILTIRRHIRIKEPEGNIDSLYFINVILVLKNLGQEAFSQ